MRDFTLSGQVRDCESTGAATSLGSATRVAALCGLVLVSYVPTLLQHFISNPYGDFGYHVDWVRELAAGHLARPHFLFHVITLGTWQLIPGLDPYTAAIVVSVGFNMFLAYLFHRHLPAVLPYVPAAINELARLSLAVGLLLVGPISLLTWPNRYLGYIGINPTHNPTILVLKPFALLLFFYACRFLALVEGPARAGHYRSRGVMMASCAAVCVLGTLAKPSYLIILVPAMLAIAAWRWSRAGGRCVSWPGLALGIVLPGMAVLAWQFWFEYGNPDASTLVVAPLEEFRLMLAQTTDYARVSLGIPARLLLSCLFPAVVGVVYFRAARSRVDLGVAWGSFLVGVGYFLLLQETDKTGHGNFGWSAQIGLLILFYVSLLFLIDQASSDERRGEALLRNWRVVVCVAVFALHLASGALFARYPYLL